ncbi:hypothetical protein ACHAWF_001475 [Thalassiosira exigua]
MSAPRRHNLSTSSSSVQYMGNYDPTSTADAVQRAKGRGNFVDLVSVNSASQPSSKKRKHRDNDKFSVPSGKRRQTLYTTNQTR